MIKSDQGLKIIKFLKIYIFLIHDQNISELNRLSESNRLSPLPHTESSELTTLTGIVITMLLMLSLDLRIYSLPIRIYSLPIRIYSLPIRIWLAFSFKSNSSIT